MNENIPALSLRQPWLHAVLHLGKLVENRQWDTRYRGRIRLHASRTWDDMGAAFIHHHWGLILDEADFHRSGWLGAYLGEVTVADCVPIEDLEPPEDEPHRWAFGPVCWLLKDPIAYPTPIPGRGYPGLYYPERFEGKR